MSAGQPLVSYDELLKELRQLCSDRRVGTLFISTADNKAASFTLLEGEIVGARFRVFRGREALPMIKNIGMARYAFADGKVADTDPDLPPTAEILALVGSPAPRPPTSARPASPSSSAAAAAPQAPPRPSRLDVGRIQIVLESELVEYLGPMAKMICREHIEKAGPIDGPPDLKRLVDGLAREIGDAAKEERFKRVAWDKFPV